MFYSTHFQTDLSGEHLRRLGVNTGLTGDVSVLRRGSVDRPTAGANPSSWCAAEGTAMVTLVCLNAPKSKSKTKTKALNGLGKGPFD